MGRKRNQGIGNEKGVKEGRAGKRETELLSLKQRTDINNGSPSSEYLEEEEEEDRLSSLPDSLRLTILSLLPIYSAAATSVLSSRWRHLWTQLTNINLQFRLRMCYTKNLEYFVTTIDHIISQLKSTTIHTFQFPLPLQLYHVPPKPPAFLCTWVSQICSRNPKVIEVSFDYTEIVSPICFSQLPTCLFQTQSLVHLTLHAPFDFDIPDDGILLSNLPILKKLSLYLFDIHHSLMGTLFKSFPHLEHLSLKLFTSEVGHCIDIVAPNLKYLHISRAGDSFESCNVVIDAPKLEEFHWKHDCIGFVHFVQNPNMLQKASVFFKDSSYRDANDYTSIIQGLFRGISCVRSLYLQNVDSDLMNTLDGISPLVFCNLVHLNLTCRCMSMNTRVARCLLPKLKKMEISLLVGMDLEMEFLKYILSSAPVLEDFRVYICKGDRDYEESDDNAPDPDELSTEYKFCSELFELPRKFLNCQIEFCGRRITASTKDFRNGVLTCQIAK